MPLSVIVTSLAHDTPKHLYTCQRQLFDTKLWNRFGIRSFQAKMISDHQVEIASWSVRNVRTAIEQGLPLPPQPPDGFDEDQLPTDYLVYQYDLTTNIFTPTVQEIAPFRDDYCGINRFCEQHVLSNSPDNQWQLVVVSSAWSDSYRGIWLVHKDFYERLIAPFDVDTEYYRTSKFWWRWQADSSGLFVIYRGAGERPNMPMYIQLRQPPTYAFLWEGIHLLPSMGGRDAVLVDEQTILLNVSGTIVQADGSVVYQKWHVFDTTTGAMRQAQADDFATYAQYVFFDNEDSLMLVEWAPDKQKQWVAAHPDTDIWNTLGDNTLFSQPYQTGGGTFLIPTSSSYDESLEITECTPQQ